MSEILEIFTRITAEIEPPRMTFTGTYDTVIVAAYADRKVVSDALPQSLELRTDRHAPAGKHPLIMTFGSQHDVAVAGMPIMNYCESVIAIPNVGLGGSSDGRVATFMPRLDVNDHVAVLLGLLVGYRKSLSIIAATPKVYSEQTLLTREPILKLSTNATTDWKTPKEFSNFRYAQSLMKQPLISISLTGRPMFTVFEWGFDSAKMQGSKATISVYHDLPALAKGDYTWDGFETSEAAAARVLVPWTLTGPFFEWP